jgi:hypothetical protein
VPGIYAEFDGPNMLGLIEPRPLLVINGELEPRTPRGSPSVSSVRERPMLAREHPSMR